MSINKLIEGIVGDSPYEVIVTGYRINGKGILWEESHK